MELFGWLFGKREPERVLVIDRVWMDADNRARAVVRELRGALESGHSTLLLAHFPSTLAALAPELIAAKLPHDPIPDGLAPPVALELATSSPPRVLFGLVRNLRVPELPAPDNSPESPLPVLVAERHFLRKHDERVVEFAEGLGSRAAVVVHMSLDDVLLKLCAGQWVTDVLKRLGMKDDEAIESAMVARRIRKAQDQIRAKLAAEEVLADSPDAWMRENVRP